MSTLLPIGTVVKLKNVEKELMIFGYYQKLRDFDKVADYIGVFYPFGHITPLYQVGFQSEDIEKVLYMGYESPAFEELKATLAAYKETEGKNP